MNNDNSLDKIALILLSSGTSGKNKKIKLTHKNIISNLHQYDILNLYNDKDICISFFDMYHIYGIFFFILFLPWKNIPYVLFDNMPSIDEYYDNIIKYNVTIIHTIPCLLPSIKPLQTTNVRMILCGSNYLGDFEHENQENRIGVPIYQMYGCTECSPLISTQNQDNHIYGGIGKILPYIDYKIIDGELFVKGDNIYLNYTNLNNPLQWYGTGDIIDIDENNNLKYIGRKRDMIKYNGKQIIPNNVEEFIRKIFKIDTYMCGIKNELNELPILISENDIDINDIRKSILSYEKPKEVYQLYKIPRNNSKKVLKYKISDSFECVDIAIVGSGIGGLYLANKIMSKNPDQKIIIIESKKNIGGNIHQFKLGDINWWSGPLRYNIDDINLMELFKKTNIKIDKFINYSVNKLYLDIINYVKKSLDLNEVNLDYDIYDFVIKKYNQKEIDDNLKFFHLIDKGITIREWLFRVEHIQNSNNKIIYSPTGIFKVVNKLAENLLIYLNCNVESINYDNNGIIEINTNKKFPFKAKKIILYIPPKQLQKINGVPESLLNISSYSKPYILYRIYILIDQEFFLNDQKFSLDLHSKEIFTFNYSDKTILMLYFSQYEFDKFWKNKIQEINLIVSNLLNKILNIKNDKIIDIKFFKYNEGVHINSGIRSNYQIFDNNIYIGHEAYGKRCGQIESTLEIANNIMEKLYN